MNLQDIRKAIIGRGPTHQESLTMIDSGRLDNFLRRIATLEAEGIPGDIVETGVCKGGSSILMAAAAPGRRLWALDTFAGFPPESKGYAVGYLAVSLEKVKVEVARLLGAEHRIEFIVGDFRQTVLDLCLKDIALLHYDGDTGEAVIKVLNALYDKVVPGGFVVIDDYCLEDCRHGLADWFALHGFWPQLISPYTDLPLKPGEIPCGAWWRK